MVLGIMDVVAMNAVVAMGSLAECLFVFQAGHFHGGLIGLGRAAFAGQLHFVGRIGGVQFEHAVHGVLEAGDGIVGVGAVGALGAVGRNQTETN